MYGSKFCWTISPSGSVILSEDPGTGMSVVDGPVTFSVDGKPRYTYHTTDADISLLYFIEQGLNTSSGANTYTFEVLNDVNNIFGRRDHRLQLRAVRDSATAYPFKIFFATPLRYSLGARYNIIVSWADGDDQIVTFPLSYGGTWMLLRSLRTDARGVPFQMASSARAQNGIIATRVREKLVDRALYFKAVPADLIFKERVGVINTKGISADDKHCTLESMWDEALRLGKPVRYFRDQDTTSLTHTGFYESFTVGKESRDSMKALIEELDDVMGGAFYNVNLHAWVHGVGIV